MSALPRKLEPELMDTEQDASDYDAMDHADVNERFCDDLLASLASQLPARQLLDVGAGTALIALELARRLPAAAIVAMDLATHMIARAASNVANAGMQRQVHLVRADAKCTGLRDGAFDAVISNSLVHHIRDPGDVFSEMWRLVSRGGLLFIRDLARPADDARAAGLVALHAPVAEGALPTAARAQRARQRALFEASLHAALTVDEVRAIVAPLGIPGSAANMTSDRHWTIAHVRR